MGLAHSCCRPRGLARLGIIKVSKTAARPIARPLKSCLKQTPVDSSPTAAKKTVSFKDDAELATCLRCSAVVARTPDTTKANRKSLLWAGDLLRTTSKQIPADAKDEPQPQPPPSPSPPPPPLRPGEAELFRHWDDIVELHIDTASYRRYRLTAKAVMGGWVDFAMYMSKGEKSYLVRKVKRHVFEWITTKRVGSYMGDEREHVRWGGVESVIPEERYESPESAMSLRKRERKIEEGETGESGVLEEMDIAVAGLERGNKTV